MTLLRTKLYIPPPRPGLVARPRLFERLDAGLESRHRLTLVSAPAGYGKTTLLSTWVAGLDRPAAWVSLDEGDSDPARFWSTVVATLQTLPSLAVSTVLETLPAALHAAQPPPLEALLTALINELAATTEAVVLVLDDYHTVKARAVHDSVAYLLDNLPPPLHLVVAGRSDPPLPLARLRGRGQLTELRIANLRFTPDETAALLRDVARLPVSPEEIAALEARTEGWVTGLQLATIALQAAASGPSGDVPRFIQQFTGSHRFVLDYLVEEVFAQQPLPTKRFLLESSILDRLAGPLCEAVTSAPPEGGGALDGQATLEALERANLFIVPLDAARRWYRYHRLFADLLRSRLERLGPDLGCAPAGELHRRASLWYEAEGLLAEAVGHALAGDDPGRAADLVQAHGLALLKRGEMSTLLGWLGSLTAGEIRSRPRLSIYQAWALALSGRIQEVESSLEAAETGAGSGLSNDAIGQIAAIRAYVAGQHGEIDRAVELVHRALAHLDEGNLVVRSVVLFTLAGTQLAAGDLAAATRTLAEARDMGQAAGNIHLAVPAATLLADLQMQQGRLHAAFDAYRRALDMAGPSPVAAQGHSGMGAAAYEWNDLEAAARHLARSIELGRLWGNAEALSADYVALAWIRRAQGDLPGAHEAEGEAQRLVEGQGLRPAAAARVSASQVRLALAQGDQRAAERWVSACGLDPEGEIHPFREWEYTQLARVLLALGQAEASGRLLARLLEAAETAGLLGYSIEILLLQALVHRAQGDQDRALAVLRRAVTLAEPEGYKRSFLDEGPAMQSLLSDLRSRLAGPVGTAGGPDARLLGCVDELLAAFPAAEPGVSPRSGADQAPAPGAGLVEPLSERELEVLRLVAGGLSNQAIADRLFIAVSTVKSHTNSIYGKLGVHSRTQAIARAEALGLL